ncbi:hypothetical protein GH714_002159 [Hevea brasiliensis]|uniref:NB-ARC domain-containing protein n=1 Tax=Hevea brasiliensis TaxID=3981 RepID=A0A6A6MA81_HEVBR|nr:hypothetical protein GH714_002159 [Hevea brasiliensis]
MEETSIATISLYCLFANHVFPNLTSMPLIPSIQHLVLINASKKLLEDTLKMKISVSQSTSSCSSISTSQLKVLQIEGIEDLEFLSEDLLQNLTSLQSLYIRNCPRLRNLSSRHLSSLVFLVIKACEELDLSDDMQWHCLRSLRKLQFRNMNKLVSLPKGLQHVPTLLTLLIKRCPNLISLPEWMRSLTELQYLFIKNVLNCQKDTKATCARIGPRLVTYQILVLIKDGFKRMAATNYDYKNQKFLLIFKPGMHNSSPLELVASHKWQYVL